MKRYIVGTPEVLNLIYEGLVNVRHDVPDASAVIAERSFSLLLKSTQKAIESRNKDTPRSRKYKEQYEQNEHEWYTGAGSRDRRNQYDEFHEESENNTRRHHHLHLKLNDFFYITIQRSSISGSNSVPSYQHGSFLLFFQYISYTQQLNLISEPTNVPLVSFLAVRYGDIAVMVVYA